MHRAAVKIGVLEVEARRPGPVALDAPERSLVSWTSLQKQVGQTIVQLPHERHRSATSAHHGFSTLRASRLATPS
jgi:hypothetical protein